MSTKYVQSNTLYQAGSGNIIGATTIVLTSLTDIYGNVLTMTDFGSKGYITLEPDTTNEEAATFTGITANANGTYSLTGVSTMLAVSPYTETPGLIRQHGGGTKVVITDNVGFWNTFANKENDATITGIWLAPTGGTGAQIATATDIANAITGASGTATELVAGTTKLSVAAVSVLNPIAVGDNDPRVPTVAQVGYIPTSGQKDALTPTSGTPSAYNVYETENDTTNAVSMTATTISFTASTKTIADSGNGFVTAGFRKGSSITVSGSASNNNTFTIVSVAAGAIVVAESLVDEVAGASDTLTTVTANKLIRASSSGLIPSKLLPATSNFIATLLAAENITAGQSVFPSSYQSAPPTQDGLTISGGASSSSSSPFGVTQAITVANHSNRILIVAFGTGAGQPSNSSGVISAVTYAGVSMTMVAGTADGLSVWYLLAPTVGTANVAFTVSPSNGGAYAYGYTFSAESWYNVAQSIPPFTTTTSSNNITQAVTEGNIVTLFGFVNINGAYTTYSATNVPNNNNVQSTAFGGGLIGKLFTGYTNELPVVRTLSVAGSGSQQDRLVAIDLAPAVANVSGYLRLASAATGNKATDGYKKMTGIALDTATIGQSCRFQFAGLVTTGLSGLTPNAIYYQSDTDGSLATTAGTNTKYVGIALTATSLLLLIALS